MKTQHVAVTMSILAAAAQSKRRCITLAGAVPAAGAWCPGLLEDNIDPGLYGAVNVSGVILAEAGAAIAAGAELECDAQGRVITRASGAVLGRALDAAAAAGDVIRILK